MPVDQFVSSSNISSSNISSSTPHPYNQKEYWKDPSLRDAVIGPVEDEQNVEMPQQHSQSEPVNKDDLYSDGRQYDHHQNDVDMKSSPAGLPHHLDHHLDGVTPPRRRDGAFREDWQPLKKRRQYPAGADTLLLNRMMPYQTTQQQRHDEEMSCTHDGMSDELCVSNNHALGNRSPNACHKACPNTSLHPYHPDSSNFASSSLSATPPSTLDRSAVSSASSALMPMMQDNELLSSNQVFLTREPEFASSPVPSQHAGRSHSTQPTVSRQSYWSGLWKRDNSHVPYHRVSTPQLSQHVFGTTGIGTSGVGTPGTGTFGVGTVLSSQLLSPASLSSPDGRQPWSWSQWFKWNSNPKPSQPNPSSTSCNRLQQHDQRSFQDQLSYPHQHGCYSSPSFTLRRCPPEIAAHYGPSGHVSYKRKCHLLCLLLSVIILVLATDLVLSITFGSRVHTQITKLFPLLSARALQPISLLPTRNTNISMATTPPVLVPPVLEPSAGTPVSSLSSSVPVDQTFRTIFLFIFVFLYYIEVLTSSTRQTLSLLPRCPTINEVVHRIKQQKPIITFGASCWHLAHHELEEIDPITRCPERHRQQNRVDGFTQTEAFDFGYCYDASDSFPLAPSLCSSLSFDESSMLPSSSCKMDNLCRSRRPELVIQEGPTPMVSDDKYVVTTGIVILDIKLSYHLLELDSVERVNELRERLRESCRHKDDFFDEQQWVSLPGLVSDYNCGGSSSSITNSQGLSIAPLICRSVVQQKKSLETRSWSMPCLCLPNIFHKRPNCWRKCRAWWRPVSRPHSMYDQADDVGDHHVFLSNPDSSSRTVQSPVYRQPASFNWLSLNAYLLMSFLLLSWPYRIFLDCYVTRDSWNVRKVVSVHDLVYDDDEILINNINEDIDEIRDGTNEHSRHCDSRQHGGEFTSTILNPFDEPNKA